MRGGIGLIAVVVAAGALGCATNVTGATNVGGDESATWVFIEASKEGETGVYRCKDGVDGVTCTKAQRIVK